MRNKFADAIYEMGHQDKRICAIVADISPAGSMVDFRNEFPERFINCGVAEQSMIGIASGLALRGLRPFCYTIATFSLYRPFEMIRDDLCYQNLPVTVVGMGAGVIYSTLGGTHHSMEDVAIASAVPNMCVLAPCDPLEMKLATQWCATESSGPTYMRLGKVGEPILTDGAIEEFEVGAPRYIKRGKDVAIISYGITVAMGAEIGLELEGKGYSCSLISFHTIKPFNREKTLRIISEHQKIIVLEEHVPHGGLGSRIKELCFDNKLNADISFYSLQDKFIHFYGTHKELLELHGLSKEHVLLDFDKSLPRMHFSNTNMTPPSMTSS